MSMKKIFFTILLSICTITSYAQQEKLYGDGTRWIITEKAYDQNEYTYCATFEVRGDTVIDAIAYKKIYKTYSGRAPYFFAAIRETADSVIYVRGFDVDNYGHGLLEEVMLYDFSKWDEGLFRMADYGSDITDIYIRNITLNAEQLSDIELSDATVTSYLYDGTLIIRGIGAVDFWGPLWLFDTLEFPLSAPMPYFYRFYRNGRLLYENTLFTPTGISGISFEDLSVKQTDDGCTVTLPTAAKWSATLYGSNGATVAHKVGEGSEIILTAESKGVHILLLDIDGKEYTKKVVMK